MAQVVVVTADEKDLSIFLVTCPPSSCCFAVSLRCGGLSSLSDLSAIQHIHVASYDFTSSQ